MRITKWCRIGDHQSRVANLPERPVVRPAHAVERARDRATLGRKSSMPPKIEPRKPAISDRIVLLLGDFLFSCANCKSRQFVVALNSWLRPSGCVVVPRPPIVRWLTAAKLALAPRPAEFAGYRRQRTDSSQTSILAKFSEPPTSLAS
jgi:hypothetical protein